MEMKWMGYFETMCKENEILGRMIQQVLLGKVFNPDFWDTGSEKTDTRIHMFFTDMSSTGKDQAIKALVNAVTAINEKKFLSDKLTINTSVDVNDAALVGTKKKEKGKITPVFGLLSKYDFLCFPECSSLFVNSEFKTTMLQTLNSAMNYPGYVSKALADVEIKYEAKSSLVMTSIPFKTMTKYLTDTGFFQRMLLHIGSKDYNDMISIAERLSDEIIMGKTEKKIDTELDDFVKQVREAWKMSPDEIKWGNGCNEKLKEYNDMFCAVGNTYTDKAKKDLFGTFNARNRKILLRMAANWSIFNLHKEVQPEDFDEPLELMKYSIDGAVKLIDKIDKWSFSRRTLGRPKKDQREYNSPDEHTLQFLDDTKPGGIYETKR